MKFTAEQIETLRNEFARINTVDPTGPVYAKMRKLLDALNQDDLKTLAAANIKFISRLAANRIAPASASAH